MLKKASNKPYQGNRWKWHPHEDITLQRRKPKTERELQEDKKFMEIIDNLPKDFFKNDKS